MSELQDFAKEPTLDSETPRPPRWPYIVGVVALVVVVLAVLYFRRRPAEVVDQPVAEAPSVTEPAPPVDKERHLELGEIPELGASDGWLREVVRQISSHPQLAEWLVTDELIRRFVAVVDNLAEGKSPSSHLAVMKPADGFRTQQRDGRYYVDPASYQRYDIVADAVNSLDTRGTVELYRAVQPLLQEAYVDLGYPGGDFERALERAVGRLLAAPVVEEPLEVIPKVSSYDLADPALERLDPATKHFLRWGPRNLGLVQAKVAELATTIGLSID